jgi:hypothetical protein
MSRRRAWHLLGSTALVTAAATACSGSSEPDTSVVYAGDVAVLMETEEFEGDVGGQGVAGTLALVGDEGCVGFAGGDPGVLIVFPPHTTVSGSDDDLVIAVDGVELRLGDRFDGGTRFNESGTADLSALGDLEDQVPEQCRDLLATPVDGFVRIRS